MAGGARQSGTSARWLVYALSSAAILALNVQCAAESSALRRVVHQLIDEATAIRDSQAAVPEKPDIASRSNEHIEPADVVEFLCRKTNKDAFIDAYVRWQLTSFEPDIAMLDDEAFLALLSTLPQFLENPQADTEYVKVMRLAEQRQRLSDADFQRLRELCDDVDARSSRADQLNQCAVRLRDWLQEHFKERTSRLLLLQIEHCAATIDGAWSTRTAKLRMTQSLTKAAKDESMTEEHRTTIEDYLNRLTGRKREFISEVTFLATKRVRMTESTAQASKANVKRRISRLRGKKKT